MKQPHTIILIGLRASGKTTVGRLLAQSLNAAFMDLDDLVLASFEERTVLEVWQKRGEKAWREAESRACHAILQHAESTAVGISRIIAFGGGVAMIPEVQQLLRHAIDSGRVHVVYLRCDVSTLQSRLREAAGDRPPLTDANDAIAEVGRIFTLRDPVYTQLASLEVDVTTRMPAEAVDEIMRNDRLSPRHESPG